MKPILIAATALFVLSPMALAQEGHTTHNHDPPPAAATEADAADVKTCMAGHEGMEGCPANMEGKMADGHKMDHADMPMMGADGMAMDKDKMMDHGADGHKMDHADMPMMNHGKKPMMGADGMAMDKDKMMDHGADGHKMHNASGDPKMSAEDCQAKHEAMGHDPAEHCTMMADKADTATTE